MGREAQRRAANMANRESRLAFEMGRRAGKTDGMREAVENGRLMSLLRPESGGERLPAVETVTCSGCGQQWNGAGITARSGRCGRCGTIFYTASVAAPTLLLTCSACARQVFTLVEGECFRCHAPAEGKNLRDMTITQCNETHSCGIKNGRHVDGWDGNWLSCEEAARR